MMFKIGDRVCKKSRKMFQNRKRIGVIVKDGYFIRGSKGWMISFILEGCKDPVSSLTLNNDGYELHLLKRRDINDEIGELDEFKI